LNERDRIALNAYLDGQLSPTEKAIIEQRLAREPVLRTELESLRATVALLKMAERVPVPRNFTLDPARYGRPARRGWLGQIAPRGMPRLALGGALITVGLVCAVVLIFSLRGGGTPMAVAPAPGAALQERAIGEDVEQPLVSTEAAPQEMAAAEVAQEEAVEMPAATTTLPPAVESYGAPVPDEVGLPPEGLGGGPGGPETGIGGAAPAPALPLPTPVAPQADQMMATPTLEEGIGPAAIETQVVEAEAQPITPQRVVPPEPSSSLPEARPTGQADRTPLQSWLPVVVIVGLLVCALFAFTLARVLKRRQQRDRSP